MPVFLRMFWSASVCFSIAGDKCALHGCVWEYEIYKNQRPCLGVCEGPARIFGDLLCAGIGEAQVESTVDKSWTWIVHGKGNTNNKESKHFVIQSCFGTFGDSGQNPAI